MGGCLSPVSSLYTQEALCWCLCEKHSLIVMLFNGTVCTNSTCACIFVDRELQETNTSRCQPNANCMSHTHSLSLPCLVTAVVVSWWIYPLNGKNRKEEMKRKACSFVNINASTQLRYRNKTHNFFFIYDKINSLTAVNPAGQPLFSYKEKNLQQEVRRDKKEVTFSA